MNRYFYGSQSEMFSFYRVPKILFQHEDYKGLSAEAKILYGLLLDRMDLSAKNNWIDKDGRVFIIFTVEEIMEKLGCGNKKACQMLSELDVKGKLIERQRQGLGKPNLICVLKFMKEMDFIPEGHFQKCQNDTSRNVNTTALEMSKGHGINTDNNYTDSSNTDSFYSDRSDLQGVAEEWTYMNYYEYFRESLEIDLLEMDTSLDKESLKSILNILVEACSSEQKTLRVNSGDKPTEEVRHSLMRLNSEHIRYVLRKLGEIPTQIYKPKQYILTILSNAHEEMPIYYKNLVAKDIAAGRV